MGTENKRRSVSCLLSLSFFSGDGDVVQKLWARLGITHIRAQDDDPCSRAGTLLKRCYPLGCVFGGFSLEAGVGALYYLINKQKWERQLQSCGALESPVHTTCSSSSHSSRKETPVSGFSCGVTGEMSSSCFQNSQRPPFPKTTFAVSCAVLCALALPRGCFWQGQAGRVGGG